MGLKVKLKREMWTSIVFSLSWWANFIVTHTVLWSRQPSILLPLICKLWPFQYWPIPANSIQELTVSVEALTWHSTNAAQVLPYLYISWPHTEMAAAYCRELDNCFGAKISFVCVNLKWQGTFDPRSLQPDHTNIYSGPAGSERQWLSVLLLGIKTSQLSLLLHK